MATQKDWCATSFGTDLHVSDVTMIRLGRVTWLVVFLWGLPLDWDALCYLFWLLPSNSDTGYSSSPESVCRHFKTCSIDQSLRCLFLKRTRKGMIRLLDWYPLIWNMKQINGPKSLYLHKLLLVSVSSAIVTVAGSLPSTSHIGVQSTNTGSGSSIILPDMPWALIVALMLPIGAPVPIRLYPLGKARELPPLPFLTHFLIEGNCPH